MRLSAFSVPSRSGSGRQGRPEALMKASLQVVICWATVSVCGGGCRSESRPPPASAASPPNPSANGSSTTGTTLSGSFSGVTYGYSSSGGASTSSQP
jgi:hypothetical protein